MTFSQRLKYLLPSYGRAQEREMSEEFESLAAIAGKQELGNLTRAALRPLILGATLGLPVAWVASRWLESMLFGLSPTDPGVIAAAVLLLGMAGMLAAHFPARRATRVDPVTALRSE